MNNTTKRHPRTMEQAFGPYTSHYIQEPHPTGYGITWWIAMVVIAIIAVVIAVAS